MPRARYILSVMTLAFTAMALPPSANANPPRCGYDRYGYHAPDWRGCDRIRYDWGGPPAERPAQIYHGYPLYRAYPEMPPAVYAAPVYGFGVYRGGRCHYDNGWYNVVVICD